MKALITVIMLVATSSMASADVTIRFIANEGVHITNGETGVLIDALTWNSYDGQFALPSDEARAAMIAGDAPYDDVAALLFTHIHGDHFDPEGAVAFVETEEVDFPHWFRIVLGSTQVFDAFEAAGGNAERFMKPEPAEGECGFTGPPECRSEFGFHLEQTHREPPIMIHVRGRPMFHREGIDHWMYRVELDGISILHLGDTQPQLADFSVWDDTEFDVILYPYWFAQMEEGVAFLDSRPDARAIAFHIPATATPLTIRAGLGEREYLFGEGSEVVIETE